MDLTMSETYVQKKGYRPQYPFMFFSQLFIPDE